MPHTLTQRDHDRMVGLHPDMIRVVKRAAELTEVAFMVVEGVRSDETCRVNYGKGRTAKEVLAKGIPASYAKPGVPKVTWLNNPYSSKHRKNAQGVGEAIDLLPAPYDWKATKPFDLVAKAMFAAAKEFEVDIRWGADWDEDGKPRERGETDSPHFELG